MNKMRIGLFDPYLDSLSGGEKYILTLASSLSENHRVSIFWDPSKEHEIKKKVEEKFALSLSGIEFKENIFSSGFSLLGRMLKSRNYDKIIFLSDGSIPSSAAPLILHFQFPVEWVNYSLKENLKMRRVEKVICNSLFTKNYIDKKFGIESILLYPPCEVDFENNIEKQNLILTVGRFGKSIEGKNFKKHDFLIKAFKKLKPKGWKFVLIISFSAEDEVEVEKLERLIGDSDIEIVKNPSYRTLRSYYRKSKIYWHAAGFSEDLEKEPEKAEHFGISTVEAMAAGAVPVVINGGGQVEIVKEGENGMLWKNEKELLEKTRKLQADEKLLDKLSKKAVSSSQFFGVKRFRKDVSALIEK